LANFRQDIGKKLLAIHKQADKSEALQTLQSVRVIGIIYDVNQISAQLLNKVVHYYESVGKNVITLGFIPEKELGDYIPTLKEEYFCKKDLTFWKLPKKSVVADFTSKDFDFLINLDFNGSIEMQAVSVYSSAKTRIGKYFEDYSFSQDFMIKSLAESGDELFNEIKKYIK
jgi:hypothetical protein|tara:strand:+ start:747 stop:1259 length:513 start_codon:yes stop_codon:yes gene_type:complete